jgi:hypothetical protein
MSNRSGPGSNLATKKGGPNLVDQNLTEKKMVAQTLNFFSTSVELSAALL